MGSDEDGEKNSNVVPPGMVVRGMITRGDGEFGDLTTRIWASISEIWDFVEFQASREVRRMNIPRITRYGVMVGDFMIPILRSTPDSRRLDGLRHSADPVQ